jgi:hypothetical protein
MAGIWIAFLRDMINPRITLFVFSIVCLMTLHPRSAVAGPIASSPLDCFAEAKKKFPKYVESWDGMNALTSLCSGATSAGPVKCFEESKKSAGINQDEWQGVNAAALLCRGAR